MKQLSLLFALSFCALSVRADLDLNGSWDFRFEEGKALDRVANAEFVATDRMTVPGCFDAMPKWYLKRGTGLYRREFFIPEDMNDAWLVVDGMGLTAKFEIDGKALGTVALPWSRFELHVGALKAGKHTVFAALDNRFDWNIQKLVRPYYDFYCYGGFYHGVTLKSTNAKPLVRTRDYRTGEIEIEISEGDRDFSTTLVFDGKTEVPVEFKNGKASVKVPDFKLWNPATPNLHRVCIRTPSAGVISTRFGIRTIEVRDRRLWLNGEKLYLKGANRHEAHPTFGAATPETLMLADIQNLKSIGGNFFRGAHYPQSQRFLDLCDEYGILVWEEALGWGNGQSYTDRKQIEFNDPRFTEDNVEQVKLMVRNSFNHPSVIIFAFMNEFESASKKGKEIADRLIAEIKSADSGRLVSYACNHTTNDIANDNTDIISFNTYPGWIGTEPGSNAHLRYAFSNEVDKIIRYFDKHYPGKAIMVSEMGTCGVYGHHDVDAAQWTEEFEAEYVGVALDTVFSRPELTGFTIWQFTDCRSFHRDGGTVRTKPFSENLAGLYDGFRRPKLVVDAVRKGFSKRAAGED